MKNGRPVARLAGRYLCSPWSQRSPLIVPPLDMAAPRYRPVPKHLSIAWALVIVFSSRVLGLGTSVPVYVLMYNVRTAANLSQQLLRLPPSQPFLAL